MTGLNTGRSPDHGDGANEATKDDSILSSLRRQAVQRREQPALIFLADGEHETCRLSHGELHERARSLAARLQAEGLAGERVLLLLPSGVDYVVAFLGCLYAKAVAVPAYPPASDNHAGRVEGILGDCDPRCALTVAHLLQPLRTRFEAVIPDADMLWIAVDEASAEEARTAAAPESRPDDLALLQYTSGSTERPRGVMVTHGNLLDHARMHAAAWELRETDVFVSWLPLFHDMGLIGAVLQPLYQGACVVLMPSAAFLQKPLRWIDALSRYKGSVAYAPDFAYALCADALGESGRRDLSSWRIACNAAETVHAETLMRFASRFAADGFRADALVPGYGLAEATLVVSCSLRPQSASRWMHCSASALEAGRLTPRGAEDERSLPIACTGRPSSHLKVVVVQPDGGERSQDGQVGEVWVQAASVARGYWRKPEPTLNTFQARLADGEGPFLRTGDLGAYHGSELYIVGRLKDLIIVRGQNHHPGDIEHTAWRAHPALAHGGGAAFAVEIDGEERLVLVLEVRRTERKRFDGGRIVEAVLAAVAQHHGLQLHALRLLKPGEIPRTSSGKIQRHACKRDFLAQRFNALFSWSCVDSAVSSTAVASASELTVAGWLQQRIAAARQLRPQDVHLDTPFTAFGIDSLELVTLTGQLSGWLGRTLPPTLLYSLPTIRSLARYLGDDCQPKPEAHVRRAGRIALEPTAIIGMACRFPGAPTLEAYWELLLQGRDAIADVPASRWNAQAEPGPTRQGGFIEGADLFDAEFFGISPREAQSMDPQQRVLLQAAWHALEDAGIAPHSLAGSRTGVFIGISLTNYRDLLQSHAVPADAYQAAGNTLSVAANRISYVLGLQGPSLAIDTACSSSLSALHQARLSLQAGDCDIAIVGGVNLLLSPLDGRALDEARMLSERGRCSVFDAAADGYTRGEGCAVIVLRRQSDAECGNDRIHALIIGSALNQDGKSNGMTAPNGLAQQAVMRDALAAAGVDVAWVGYVEAHGTGTALGDPIEAESIMAVYGAASAEAQPLWLGSAKTNIGHLEAAAGMAGLIKAALAVKHGKLPPHLHLRQLNPAISFDSTRCEIVRDLREWPDATRGRHAAVSAFGFGGANAHVVMAQASQFDASARPGRTGQGESWWWLALSARTPSALKAVAQAHALRLEALSGTPDDFSAICATAAIRRSHHPRRLCVVARSSAQAAEALRAWCRGETPESMVTGEAAPSVDGKLAFFFRGDNLQCIGAGGALYERYGVFRQALDDCEGILQRWLGQSVLSAVFATPTIDPFHVADSELGLVACQYAMARLWQSFDVRPECVAGEGLGEVVAACIAEVLTLEDTLALAWHRARLVQHAQQQVVPRDVSWDFDRCLESIRFRPARLPVVSHLEGSTGGLEITQASYWRRQALASAQPAHILQRLHASGCTRIIEVKAGAGDADFNFQRELARHHVTGGTLALASVFPTDGPVVDLPHYPFALDRHWFEAPPAPTAWRAPAGGHPLVGRVLSVAGSGSHHFENTLSTGTVWLLDQHRVHGSPIMPAAGIMEWVLAALGRATGSAASDWVLQPIEFHRMLHAEADADTRVQVAIEPRPQGFRVTGYSRRDSNESDPWLLHFTASAVAAPAGAVPPAASLSRWQDELLPVDVAGFYEGLGRLGLSYGPGYQALKQAWRSDSRLLARIELPANRWALAGCQLHPGLLDACLHSLYLDDAAPRTVFLPTDLHNLRMYRPLPERFWCMARWQEKPDAFSALADLILYDDNGDALANLQGLRLMQVAPMVPRALGPAPDLPGPEDRADLDPAAIVRLAPEEARRLIGDALFLRVARSLHLPSTEDDGVLRERFGATRLNALGVDSLVAMELRNRLLHDWAVDVPVQMFIGGARGIEVVDHILGQLQVRQLIAAPSDEVEGEEREMWTL